MASFNPRTREITIKVVYYGPGLGGKTSTLQYIHRTTEAEHCGKLVSLATPVDRTLYFDFLPVQMPKIGDHSLRLQLFTVPGQVHYNATRKLVLGGADGVVFVADSQSQRMDANLESLKNLKDNLADLNVDWEAIPLVFQYNKRDLPAVEASESLQQSLNPGGRKSVDTVATTGEGLYVGLETIVKEVLRDLKKRELFGQTSLVGLAALEGQVDFHKNKEGIAKTLEEYSASGTNILNAMKEELTVSYPIPVENLETFALPEENETGSSDTFGPLPPIPSRKMGKRLIAQSQAEEDPELEEGFSFTVFWPSAERETALAIEAKIGKGEDTEAMNAIWKEIRQRTAGMIGDVEDLSVPRLLGLLGLEGREFLRIARAARRSEGHQGVSREQVLVAYFFLLRLLRGLRDK